MALILVTHTSPRPEMLKVSLHGSGASSFLRQAVVARRRARRRERSFIDMSDE